MSTKKLYKIILILFAGVFILGIGYGYTSIFGNPVVKISARYHIERYVKFNYPENYSIGRVFYNFTTESYGAVLMDNNKKKYTDIYYFDDILLDDKEGEILDNKLNKEIRNMLKEINFNFENVMCSSSACINANQKFEATVGLDRYDLVSIQIINKNEISKDEFVEMVLAIIPEIKTNMYYKEGSKIGITYQFEKYNFEFSVKEADIKLTKEYIAENSIKKTWRGNYD
ncbi:MAG: YfjL-like protein [Ruminiclostridium sp.]